MKRLLILLVLLAPGTLIAGGWEGDSASSSGATIDVSCGAVHGDAGLLLDWGTQESDDFLASEDGEVGAYWHGEQYHNMSGGPGSESGTITHQFRWTGSDNERNLNVQLTTLSVAGGSAEPMIPGHEWWWTATVMIADSQPTVTHIKKDGSKVTWNPSDVTDSWEQVMVTGTGGQKPATAPRLYAGVSAISPFSANGSYDADYGPIHGRSTDDRLQVVYSTAVTASGDVDNGNVSHWKVCLESDLFSEVYN